MNELSFNGSDVTAALKNGILEADNKRNFIFQKEEFTPKAVVQMFMYLLIFYVPFVSRYT